jgi:hypothetical protein
MPAGVKTRSLFRFDEAEVARKSICRGRQMSRRMPPELRFMRFASRSRGASNPDCHLDFRCTGLHVLLFLIERN